MAGLKFAVHTEALDVVRDKIVSGFTKAEHAVAQQAVKDTDHYVPERNHVLKDSARVKKNIITYGGEGAPHASVLWRGMQMVDAKTGKGPGHYQDKKGNWVVRFRKGQVLKASDKPLKISTAKSPYAQDHWFDASEEQNREEWDHVAAEALVKYANK